MKKKIWEQVFVIGTVLLCCEVCIPLSMGTIGIHQEKNSHFRGTTWYVGGSGPGNYTKIQDAIDNASNGDTVFVYHDVYYENVLVDKSIDLTGENQATTIIDGQGHNGSVMSIFANTVTLSGFTMQNCGDVSNAAELYIVSSDVYIRNNTMNCTVVPHGEEGIWCMNSSGTIDIEHNTIMNHWYGIWLEDCTNIVIANNTIMNNGEWGIIIGDTTYSSIAYNTLMKNKGGIYLRDSNNNGVARNTITKNTEGGVAVVELDAVAANNAIVYNNLFSNRGHDAAFVLGKHSHSKNTWDKNYWGRPYLLPKIIIGRKAVLDIPGIPFHFPPMTLLIPWFTTDPHPAQGPFRV